MFHLVSSNRLDSLLHALHERMAGRGDGTGTVLEGSPLQQQSPLYRHTVIVPSSAVQRAVTRSVSQRYGICADVDFAFLAQWLWRQMARVVPGIAAETPFDAQVLTWRIEQVFADATFTRALPRLGPYLAAADDAARFDLAQRTAALLEAYTTYRADWLASWSQDRAIAPPCEWGNKAQATNTQQRQAFVDDERWQRALWRRLTNDMNLGPEASMGATADAPPGTSRPDARQDDPVERFLQALRQNPQAARNVLPTEVHVMALPAMPPQHLRVLRALASVIDVHVYALNPCEAYWFDIVEPKRRARLQARGQGQHTDVGHRLLAAWGRQAQSQLAMLHAELHEDTPDEERFQPPSGEHRLARLQRAVLTLDDGVTATDAGRPLMDVGIPNQDQSIELHVCHSLRRQLEVLQNRLLWLFSQPDAPGPDEVLVVTPALDDAAPLIDAVFGVAQGAQRIAYNITGRASGQDGGVTDAFLALLDAGTSRWSVSQWLGLLHQPLVLQALGWTSDDAQLVQGWWQDAGLAWGLDAEHRASFGVPPDAAHTMDDALDRLVLGHVMHQDNTAAPWLGRWAAGHATGTRAALLGTLTRWVQAMAAMRQTLSKPKTAQAWHAMLLGLVDAHLKAETPAEHDGLRDLRLAMSQWVQHTQQAQHTGLLPLAIVRAALQAQGQTRALGGVPSGSVTFASMSSLRGLPYRVVCAIGLDDGTVPSRAPPLAFDLMAQAPRAGDRQRQHDDRNLMLDLLLAASDRLWLMHAGRDVRDNTPRVPAVVVSELLDALAHADGIDVARLRQHIEVVHPLQPFAPSLYTPNTDARQQSFDATYAAALLAQADRSAPLASLANAESTYIADDEDDDEDGEVDAGDTKNADDADDTHDAAQAARNATPFFTQALPALQEAQRHITLDDLQRFFANPARALLSQRLGLRLPREDDQIDDDEPFALHPLARSDVLRRLMPMALGGAEAAALKDAARASGALPMGPLGDLELTQILTTVQSMAAAVGPNPWLDPPPPLTVVMTVHGEPWHVTLALRGLRVDGLLRWHAGSLRAKHCVAAWLDHVALAIVKPDGVAGVTQVLARDHRWTLPPLVDAAPQLQRLVSAYAEGLVSPLPFMPETSMACLETPQVAPQEPPQRPASQRPRKPKAFDAMTKAAKAFHGSGFAVGAKGASSAKLPSDATDPHVQLAWRGQAPMVEHPQLIPWAQALLGDMVRLAQKAPL
jgi:exodeoxyribonuclease V gamma subunit